MNKTLTVSLLATTTLALGAVGLMKLAADRAAPTPLPPAGVPRPESTLEPPTPEPTSVVVLDEVHIVGRAARPRPAPTTAPRELVPCSGWRPIGPVFSVREGERPRQRRVRMMCAAPR
jgi:hypothetical protein